MDPARYVLALDGTVHDPAVLAGVEFLECVVRGAAKISGMRVINMVTSNIAHDLSKLDAERFEDEGGISVLALTSTSHIALHAWDARARFMFDLVSCRPFDAPQLKTWLMSALDVKELSHASTNIGRDAVVGSDGPGFNSWDLALGSW